MYLFKQQAYLRNNCSHLGDSNPFPGPHTKVIIPNKSVGLIIGKNGETIKQIHEKTNAYIFIPKDSPPGEDFRVLELSGTDKSVEMCKREIISMVHLALYGKLPYTNSTLYPYIDPESGLPIIEPGIISQLDPTHEKDKNHNPYEETGVADYFQYLQQKTEKDEEGDYLKYNLEDYDDPANYDIYYQSLYQMYPQMADFYRKTKEYKENEYTAGEKPFMFFNAGVLNEDSIKSSNSVYDPHFVTSYNDYLTKPQARAKIDKPVETAKQLSNEEYYDPYGIRDTTKVVNKGFSNKPEFSEKEFNKYLDKVYYSKTETKRLHDKQLINDAVDLYYNKYAEDEEEGNENKKLAEDTETPVISQVPAEDKEAEKPKKAKRSRFDVS